MVAELVATVVMWLIIGYVVERVMDWLDGWSRDTGGDSDGA